MTPAEIFAKHGLHNAADLARAAETAGLSYSIAAALAEKESGGRNIYGHDAGGVLSTKRGPVTLEGIVYPRGGDIPVTYENFTQHFLPAVLGGAVSNGVGPLQITYPGYFTQRPSYPWWDPYMSAVVGYTDFVTYLKGGQDVAAIEAAGSRYNSGSYTKAARTYGADLATLVAKWDTWLKASTPEGPMTDQQYTKAMSTLGNVTPNTRKKALAVLRHCQETLGRAPGVLWGSGSSSEHVSGRAIDFMVTQHGMGVDTEMGNVIAEFVLAHGLDWGLGWVIWRQRIYPASGTYLENPKGGWRTMEDRGSTTQNHMDHPHVYFETDTYSNGASVVPDQENAVTPQQHEQLMGELRGINQRLTYLHDLFTPGEEKVKFDGQTFRQLRSIEELVTALRDQSTGAASEDDAAHELEHDAFQDEIRVLQEGLAALQVSFNDLLARRAATTTTQEN